MVAISALMACSSTPGPNPPRESIMPVATAASPQALTLNPFKAIVRQRVRRSFAALGQQDPEPALALMDEHVKYTFDTVASRHALAGTRQSKQAVRRWFTRLFTLLPGQFAVHRIDVSGWPWRASVLVEFEDRVQPRVGAPYVNRGRQEVELHWGKAVRIHTHVETEKVERALAELARHGVAESAAPPIED
jgi:ketosteroid isomerase-like protein